MSAVRWKMFFDITCPNSWISLQKLKSDRMFSVINQTDFVPICDVKLTLIRTYEQRMTLRRRRKAPDYVEEPQPFEFPVRKEFMKNDNILPKDFEEIYATTSNKGSLLPAVFLSVVKKQHQQNFMRSIDVVGDRIWNRRLPVHKGAHLFACAQEAGISFKDSDEIIARLAHVDSRQALHINSERALQLGANYAPFFALSSEETARTFDNFYDFERFVLGT
ncbi:hypothetical protein Q1695_012713 [Nippostrongylus brasiliensis]|nr:hypothetical protein Q1695_012713 [Nippostrongylus brasiliensis]